MSGPLVTVICLCHNQARFVGEALESVRNQTWPSVQLIVVDDASTDDSAAVIRECLAGLPSTTFLQLPQNVGNCTAFNKALAFAEGDYIIDFAADDILLPDRIRVGVEALTAAGDKFGVNFTDANWMDEEGRHLYTHSSRFPHETIPQGDIYVHLIRRFFICSPTVMFRTHVIRELGGYDESLAYEDFDFWMRSSRIFKYCYTPQVLVQKRVVSGSMSEKQFKRFSPQLRSTFRICEKILEMNRSRDEQAALSERIKYEMRVAARFLDAPLLAKYASLWMRNRRKHY